MHAAVHSDWAAVEDVPTETVLELYAGGGGLSFGLSEAGFQVAYAVEHNPTAAAALKANHPETVVSVE